MTLCDSGYIPPGFYLPQITLQQPLQPGEIEATAYLVRYSMQPLQQEEVFSQMVTIAVGS